MRARITTLLCVAALGCGVEPDAELAAQAGMLTDEEIDAKTLEMLNHASTTVKVLDIDAALSSATAAALISHRDGPDAVFETADDDLYDSLLEVDDVKGVGAATLAQIRAFAATWEPPKPPDPNEVNPDQKALDFLNHATTTLTILDVNVSLTATAAKNLIQHRDGPDAKLGTADDDLYDTLKEVDDVPYIGESALAAIVAYAANWTPVDPGATVDTPKILLMLNHVTTTRKILESKVGLTSTQSNSLVQHRDGPDALPGTEDDDPYDSKDEIDAQQYIGAVSLTKLEAYASTWVAQDPAALLEQEVLTFLNHETTTKAVLTSTVGLPSNAATSLIAWRDGPDGKFGTEDDNLFDTLKEVDDVLYIGEAALLKIKTYAPTFDPSTLPPPGTDLPLSCATCGIFAGDPLEFDSGPPPGSGWAELFAAVPNFRQVAVDLGAAWLAPGPDGLSKLDAVNAAHAALDPPEDPIQLYTLTKDKFRFHMGPLFYRGRLDGTARVLVIGQEGATDEAIVHRAFVGGTGQKMQNYLNALGITRSYLFVNTFVYSIFEQYDEFTAELAMSGPIKEHRNQILKKAFDENPIQLVVTVGNAAYESLKIFQTEFYDGKFPKGIRWSHVLHPGAAATAYGPGTSSEVINDVILKAVVSSFTDSWKHIWYWRYIDPGWLPPDPDGWQFQASKFFYGDRDIPFRDLPYGSSPQVGRGGTKTERGASGLQVQLRSSNSLRYEAPTAVYPATPAKAKSGFEKDLPEEVAWEPPKLDPDARHDPGPNPEWVQLIATTPAQAVIETESGIDTHNDFHQRPIWYRGRLSGDPSVLVIAIDPGFDGVVAGRTLVGDAGQKINHLLANVGSGPGYVMLTPYPYPLSNSVALHDRLNLAMSLSLSTYRNALITKLLQEKPISLVLTFGEEAHAAFQSVSGGFAGTWLQLAHPTDASAPGSWNDAMAALSPLAAELGLAGAFKPYTVSGFSDVRMMIPREDLPWGVPMWFGTSGDLSQQPSESWIFWNAPKWIAKELPGG